MKAVEFKESNFIGKTFNYLTIIEFTRNSYCGKKKKQIHRHCLAKCRCGNIKEYDLNNLRSGGTKSCGCRPLKEGKEKPSTHPLYGTYTHMLERCYNYYDDAYKHYGGRGIKVCKRWQKSFADFLEDMGDKPDKNYTLDRINNDGDYEPSNCRWATWKQQANNRRRPLKWQKKIV